MSDINPQRITRLEINNVLRIVAVEVFPSKDCVTIAGENGAGKSSVLNSIIMALGGAGHIPPQPVHKGAANGEIVVELNDLIVRRKFSQKTGSTLVVTTKEGTPLSSPQTILDKLTGELTFDPLEFARIADKRPKEAVETLMNLAKLDFTKQDAERAELYSSRTDTGRDLKSARARAQAATTYEDAPTEEVSVAELTEELKKVQAHNKAHNEAVRLIASTIREDSRKVENAEAQVNTYGALIKELEEKLKAARESLTQAERLQSEAKARLDVATSQKVATELKDEAPILQSIADADGKNTKVRANAAAKKLWDEVKALDKKQQELTTKIEALDQSKQDALAAAKFPIPEISFNDEGVLLNALPFVQASTAEQIRASMAIGLALNPKLRVVLIRDASLLDDKSMSIVAKMAAENNAQVWLEVVKSDDDAAVIIEDGHVQGEEPEPVSVEQGDPNDVPTP